MSLSPLPTTIRKDAPYRVCKKLWAAAIHFCKVTGATPSPFYTSVIWSGLLYAVRDKLIPHDLLEPVRGNYMNSISSLYHLSLDDVELLAELKSFTSKLWVVITESFDRLNTEVEVSVFLTLAESLCSDTEDSSFVPSTRQLAEFQAAVNVLSLQLSSAIYDEPTNPYIIEHPDPYIDRRSSPKPPMQPVSAPPQAKPLSSSRPVQKQSRKPVWPTVLIILSLLIAAVAILQNPTPVKNTPQTTAPTINQLPKPRSGTILKGREYEDSTITVTADSGSDFVVTLKDKYGTDYVVFYVRAGATVTVGVPGEYLYVYFASGDNWYGYGKGKMFGENTVYSKDDELLDFVNYSWEYTLYPVSDGNFSETPSNEDEFF